MLTSLVILGNPNPRNLPPAQLVMPDFAESLGGFGAGESRSNATFYLVVLEEYVTGTVSYPSLPQLELLPFLVAS